ncbi:MAG: hypothetical protein JSS09_01045, partial [Verrucomicrobia bacterium]|nr:hypothetical protein [Verrucomicrobiota bacterium]
QVTLKKEMKYTPPFKDSRLSQSALNRLSTNLRRAGFNVETELNVFPKIMGHQAVISLSKTQEDESGYLSDGWNPSFRSSIIHRKNKDALTEAQKEMLAEIEDEIRHRAYASEHHFSANNLGCPPFLESELIEGVANKLYEQGIPPSSIIKHRAAITVKKF